MEKYTYKKLTLESFTKIMNEVQEKMPNPVMYIIRNGKMYEYFPNIEYNTDTSAGHPVKDDDIVRYSEETQRVQDKELEH